MSQSTVTALSPETLSRKEKIFRTVAALCLAALILIAYRWSGLGEMVTQENLQALRFNLWDPGFNHRGDDGGVGVRASGLCISVYHAAPVPAALVCVDYDDGLRARHFARLCGRAFCGRRVGRAARKTRDRIA